MWRDNSDEEDTNSLKCAASNPAIASLLPSAPPAVQVAELGSAGRFALAGWWGGATPECAAMEETYERTASNAAYLGCNELGHCITVAISTSRGRRRYLGR